MAAKIPSTGLRLAIHAIHEEGRSPFAKTPSRVSFDPKGSDGVSCRDRNCFFCFCNGGGAFCVDADTFCFFVETEAVWAIDAGALRFDCGRNWSKASVVSASFSRVFLGGSEEAASLDFNFGEPLLLVVDDFDSVATPALAGGGFLVFDWSSDEFVFAASAAISLADLAWFRQTGGIFLFGGTTCSLVITILPFCSSSTCCLSALMESAPASAPLSRRVKSFLSKMGGSAWSEECSALSVPAPSAPSQGEGFASFPSWEFGAKRHRKPRDSSNSILLMG